VHRSRMDYPAPSLAINRPRKTALKLRGPYHVSILQCSGVTWNCKYMSHLLPALLIKFRLQDPVIDIVIGNEDAAPSNQETCRRWCLSQALISYHSPFLAAERRSVTSDPSKTCIALSDESPMVFAMFVDWMCKSRQAYFPSTH
jgi:hypothetical protein